MSKRTLCCTFLLICVKYSSSVDYCNLPCKLYGSDNQFHDISNIACQNPGCKTPGIDGCELDHSEQTEFRDAFLDKHNEFRNMLALGELKGFPKAANMYELAYDENLEFTSECNTIGCIFDHDQCHITKDWENSGQNLCLFQGNIFAAKESVHCVELWFDEYKLVKKVEEIVGKFSDQAGTGHFTALVWAVTTHVGCSRSKNEKDTRKEQYIACNYSPVGNFLQNPIYEKGEPCTNCQNGCSTNYPGLCKNTLGNIEKHPDETKDANDTESQTDDSWMGHGPNITREPGEDKKSKNNKNHGEAAHLLSLPLLFWCTFFNIFNFYL